MTRVDPITLEIVRHALIAAADEMKINLTRTAYNPIIYEVLDFSVGLFDRNGDIISQAAGLPIFLGNLGEAVKVVSQDVGLENFEPGDIYLINDTYTSGTHLNDVTVISPVFVNSGQELIGFAASRAHWLDMGGRDPGGWFTDTTEIYQEGLRMRSVRLYEAGQPNRSIFQIIRDNVRYADSLMGDLRAQIAAGRTGEQRFRAIVDHYGLETVNACIAQIHDEGEQISRSAVVRMNDGVYSAEAFMDDDGVSVDRPKVKVTVTVSGEEMTIDLTGSEPQCAGPINCGLAATISGVRVAFKCVTSPFTPVTEGDFRPLKIVVPDDSMFNAQLPAPSGVYGIILMTLCDVIFMALAEAIPDQIPAAHYCDVCAVFIFGTDPRTGRPYLHVEPEGGGWGAFANRDGENVLIAIADGDTRNVPVEVLEARFPLRVERYEVRQDSGGPGKFRGGLGHYRDYLILDHDAFLTTVQERTKCPPWGLAGGKAAAVNALIVNPDTPEAESIKKVNAKPVKSGSHISVRTGGGGGYGDSSERDSELVRLDVVRGYVSLEAAREAYGVALRPDTLEIDVEETRRLRSGSG
jgi:N-methylhydantoinase B